MVPCPSSKTQANFWALNVNQKLNWGLIFQWMILFLLVSNSSWPFDRPRLKITSNYFKWPPVMFRWDKVVPYRWTSRCERYFVQQLIKIFWRVSSKPQLCSLTTTSNRSNESTKHLSGSPVDVRVWWHPWQRSKLLKWELLWWTTFLMTWRLKVKFRLAYYRQG